MQTQNQIDEYELNELNQKIKLLSKIDYEKKKIIEKNILKRKGKDKIKFDKNNILSVDDKTFKRKSTRQLSILLKKEKKNNIKIINNHKNKENENEIDNENMEYINNPDFERELKFIFSKRKFIKLCTIKTCFSEKYNLLFISSTNNKISGWRYNSNSREFKNVNICIL